MGLFLETTIQIGRVVGDDAEQKRIRRNCAGYELFSSAKVLGEFVTTLIQDAAIFHMLVVDSATVSDALRRFDSFPGLRFRVRRQQRAIAIFGSIIENGSAEKDDVILRLERLIEWQLLSRFFEDLAGLELGAQCEHVRWQPRKRNDGLYDLDGLKCLKSSPPACRVLDFVREKRGDIERIVDLLEGTADEELEKVRETARALIDNTDVPFGQNCYTLADMIIALEAPTAHAIYTTNRKHFEPLAQAVGKSLHTET